MRYLLIVALVALSACGGGHGGTYGNRDYARNCGNAMDELGMCGGYNHEF